MITSADLAKLRIHRTIFHDVPNKPRNKAISEPILADLETQIDAAREDMLRIRMTQVLGSRSSYPIKFAEGTGSPVPAEVRSYTTGSNTSDQFIEMSKRLALFLFEQHTGAISPGLLCVIEVTSGDRRGLALLKLERERGAELKFLKKDGKRIVDMSVIDDLILTDGTRLFKTALFIRTGTGDDAFKIAACDSQRTIVTSDDVARFWLRFLGCVVFEEPRVTTQKWFEASISFANEQISDAVIKNDFYQHVHSELTSNRKTVSPRKFIEDYVPSKYRQAYQEFLADSGVSVHSFDKDIADINGRLRRRSFHTAKGAVVTVPEDEAQLVEVERQRIVVNDELRSVDHHQ
jgi:hypothetical protein